jgi:hypothetical protein
MTMMKQFLKNALIAILGLLLGGSLNMGIIMISGSVIPPPNGADVTTKEGLRESIHLFEVKHFIMPFLAHALGTLLGALFTAFFVRSEPRKWAVFIGCFFLIGGVSNVVMLPTPIWFAMVDIAIAYIPMAYLGAFLADRFKREKNES